MMKTKHMVLAVIAIIALLVVFLWNTCGPFLMNQTMITGYVKLNAEELEVMAQEAGYAERKDGTIRYRRWSHRSDMVEFECWAFGIAPASKYKGFYYSMNDEPIPFQGVMQELVESGKGWAWQQPESDNHGYTEKIMDNWYYFEASF